MANSEKESFVSPMGHDAGLSFTSICNLRFSPGQLIRACLEYRDQLRPRMGDVLIHEAMCQNILVVLKSRLRLRRTTDRNDRARLDCQEWSLFLRLP
jgi:hypothetical protein